jgi:histidine triad (HIT) family protein
MDTIFTKIIKGEISCYKLAENEKFISFLDISPLSEGHALVVPKLQNDYIFDLDDALLADMIVFAKKVAVAIKKNVPCLRIGVAVIGLEVPHTHIHLVPINHVGDLNFSNPKIKLTDNEFKEISAKIAASIEL